MGRREGFCYIVICVAALLLDSGASAQQEPIPRTCDSSSASARLPFCDASLTWTERVADLVTRLNTTEKLQLITKAQAPTPFIERLNLKSFLWDMTCVHGPYLTTWWPNSPNVSVFVMPIGQAATFDLDLVYEMTRATVDEARAVSNLQYQESNGQNNWFLICNGGPLANLAQSPTWGRTSETYGEDNLLAAMMGVVVTEALQMAEGDLYLQTASVTRHWSAYSGPEGFLDNARFGFDANMSAYDLEDAMFPVFEAIHTTTSPEGVMCSYSALNGVPSCANSFLLGDKLRDEWQSDSYVVSDWGAVENTWQYMGYATDEADGVAKCINGGLQLCYTNIQDLYEGWVDSLGNGTLQPSQLDAIVSRLLMTRFRLGEFAPSSDVPYYNLSSSVIDSPEHRKLARDSAARSIVLLKNSGSVLPLQSRSSQLIAVIGPNAEPDGLETYLHSYFSPTSKVVSVLEGITDAALERDMKVLYAKGCDVNSTDTSGFAEAVTVAQGADVVVIVLGLNDTVSAEALDRTNITLPGVQQLFLETIRASTSNPIIVVLVSGDVIYFDDSLADAVLQAWYGGEEAGNAVADILFGVMNPSGKLPLTFYNATTPIRPITDYHLHTFPGKTYRYLQPDVQLPLYQFGFGLSYTTFQYSGLQIFPLNCGSSCSGVSVNVTVENTGDVDANETVQIYVKVPIQSSPTPILSLQGFKAIPLGSGAKATLSFSLTPYQLSNVNPDGSRTVNTGTYIIYAGGHLPGDSKGDAVSNVIDGAGTAYDKQSAAHEQLLLLLWRALFPHASAVNSLDNLFDELQEEREKKSSAAARSARKTLTPGQAKAALKEVLQSSKEHQRLMEQMVRDNRTIATGVSELDDLLGELRQEKENELIAKKSTRGRPPGSSPMSSPRSPRQKAQSIAPPPSGDLLAIDSLLGQYAQEKAAKEEAEMRQIEEERQRRLDQAKQRAHNTRSPGVDVPPLALNPDQIPPSSSPSALSPKALSPSTMRRQQRLSGHRSPLPTREGDPQHAPVSSSPQTLSPRSNNIGGSGFRQASPSQSPRGRPEPQQPPLFPPALMPTPASPAAATKSAEDAARMRQQLERERHEIEQKRLQIERERAQMERERAERARMVKALMDGQSSSASALTTSAALSSSTSSSPTTSSLQSTPSFQLNSSELDSAGSSPAEQRALAVANSVAAALDRRGAASPNQRPTSARKLPTNAPLPPPLAGERKLSDAPAAVALPPLSERQQSALKHLQAISMAEKEVNDLLNSFPGSSSTNSPSDQ